MSRLPTVLESGVIKPLRAEVIPGGLEGITTGMDKLKSNKVSGAKVTVSSQ